MIHQADLLATFAEILDQEIPDNAGEDSFSLFGLLQGEDSPVRIHAVSCSGKGLPGIRSGNWKLILGPGSGGWAKGSEDEPIQLYNLAEDIGETQNLAAQQPERVTDMKAVLDSYIQFGRSTPGPAQKNDVPVVRYSKKLP